MFFPSSFGTGVATVLTLLVVGTSAVAPLNRAWPLVSKVDHPLDAPLVDRNGTELPPLNTTYYFDQLIDHTNPSLGTFKQRYWHTWDYYESGGPIILLTPGEGNADGYTGYLTNRTVNGMVAQELNGATIVIEHRYYGLSNPYNNLSVESLKYHTIEQAVNDLEYFAYNVKLPMPGGDQVTPDDAPWILIGGSYAGALTAFTKVNKPDAFYAAWASSAVVESIVDFWDYFDVIRQHMPQNCSADVQAVIAHIDSVFDSTNYTAIDEIKTMFNMNLTNLDDFASALQNPMWDWQSLDVSPNLTDPRFYEFCDALEVKDNETAPESGWGLDHALNTWADYWTTTYLPELCGDEDIESCAGTYNPNSSLYTTIAVDNAARSWNWIVCNEMGFWQDGAPADVPTVVSRLIGPGYWERQCMLMFPEAFSAPPTPSANETNQAYGGWFMQADRLFFANGENDPWRGATVSADGTNFQSTDMQPIAVGDGFHCSDLIIANGEADSTVAAVQQQGLAAMKSWLEGWQAPSRR
ncbi:peptidase S28 [Rhodofomes roseus]|uniref:Peptidase S28 n=1 Tax=Rhodofomes roseus TaxID=34475 RepID=A0ABQ8KM68_9APHY|nr:peptidase S28 [Rhodofomes roseus]KAH9839143.1 peptidase S28 [Rhodofomes roseus]